MNYTAPLLTALFSLTALLHGQNLNAYMDRSEAKIQSRRIIHRLFQWPSLDFDAQQKVNDFANDFAKNSFTPDVNYSLLNENNVAHMTIEACVEWVCEQAGGIATREALTNHSFNPHFNGINHRNLEPLKKAVRLSIRNQITRISSKPLESILSGDFSGYIGGGLIQKVRDQMQEIIARDCAAYCAQDSTHLILLDCGHKLHDNCLNSLSKPKCPVCRADVSYALPTLATAKPSQGYPRPSYQQAYTQKENHEQLENNNNVLLGATVGGAAALMYYLFKS